MDIQFSRVEKPRLQQVRALYEDTMVDPAGGADEGFTLPRLERDRELNRLYCAWKDGRPCAAFTLRAADEECPQIAWLYGVRPAVLSGLAVTDDALIPQVLAFAGEEALRLGCDSLRAEASGGSEQTLRHFGAEMAREAGRVSPENRRWFESPLDEACPMLPVRMHPAYRYGDMTPWGGDGLRTAFHRDIPDERTGEALEISAIPKLESVTDMGETLSELLERDGARLAGDYAGEAFPLLLKLLAAKQPLSVQVHPDDAYAREHENKLGKTEAWVILKAEEGASILYGIKEGVTLERLRAGLESGEDIEPLIARVPVRAGDVYYMPSGMVHAIGGGIVLYEIQQSSDVTYRLWDYNRTNAAGEKRPLHIRQSLDVIDPALKGRRARMPETDRSGIVNLLDVPAFRLDCACVGGECPLSPAPHGFRMLTALAALRMSWQGGAMDLAAGDSVLLPASCPAVTLTGLGRALISTPPRG